MKDMLIPIEGLSELKLRKRGFRVDRHNRQMMMFVSMPDQPSFAVMRFYSPKALIQIENGYATYAKDDRSVYFVFKFFMQEYGRPAVRDAKTILKTGDENEAVAYASALVRGIKPRWDAKDTSPRTGKTVQMLLQAYLLNGLARSTEIIILTPDENSVGFFKNELTSLFMVSGSELSPTPETDHKYLYTRTGNRFAFYSQGNFRPKNDDIWLADHHCDRVPSRDPSVFYHTRTYYQRRNGDWTDIL
jgi:hypothetical protein